MTTFLFEDEYKLITIPIEAEDRKQARVKLHELTDELVETYNIELNTIALTITGSYK